MLRCFNSRRVCLYTTVWCMFPIMLSAQTDPGVRRGPAGAGGPVDGLSCTEFLDFKEGSDIFKEVDSVKGTIPDTGSGLGPKYNLDSCAGCHVQPAIGGSSPAVNPQ